ncbi:ribonuclease HII [Sulfurimonas sp. C5]|uniref:ribonuclease HII n=1 Tax=Sulfurimonas sp. C5 TaxID=3036947 RepID=UPI002458E9C2|nr:ribonuclease HII [Sulfurimonas sp. C5]MDH4944727.1 ribonuclease HII [Sulfurimonas sp. C5]
MLCGIDEAGRGCIAGDLVVAGCIFLENTPNISGLNDSKKITEKKRYQLYDSVTASTQYHIVTKSPQEIDEKGISVCMREALEEIKSQLNAKEYLFDGNTTFGVKDLKTMVKADGKVPEVSAASILAKVTHDRNIVAEAQNYPEYGFEKHKGYGTAPHIASIQKHGYSPIHRQSYKIKALQPSLFDSL